jgi:hypothetical protein
MVQYSAPLKSLAGESELQVKNNAKTNIVIKADLLFFNLWFFIIFVPTNYKITKR